MQYLQNKFLAAISMAK